MNEIYISFYLRANRIHIYVDVLREIGSPKFFCFLIQNEGTALAIVPYKKRDFISHRVSPKVYSGTDGMEISSMQLCHIISDRFNWNQAFSYRVPGIILADHTAAVFNLMQAEVIEKPWIQDE